MISEDKEIGFLESEVDRLENKIMPLRIKLDGYRHMLNRKRLEKVCFLFCTKKPRIHVS